MQLTPTTVVQPTFETTSKLHFPFVLVQVPADEHRNKCTQRLIELGVDPGRIGEIHGAARSPRRQQQPQQQQGGKNQHVFTMSIFILSITIYLQLV